MPGPAPDPTARQRILDATDHLLERHGYARMTIQEVARHAGVGKGSVYLHFPSKAELALACLDRMAIELLASLTAVADGQGTVAARLAAMLRLRVLHRFDYARRHADSIDQMMAALRAEHLLRRAEHFRREAALLARVLDEGRAAGEVCKAPARATADALVTATNALLPYSLSVRELGRRAQLARRTQTLIDILLAGLAAPPSTPSTRRTRRPA